MFAAIHNTFGDPIQVMEVADVTTLTLPLGRFWSR